MAATSPQKRAGARAVGAPAAIGKWAQILAKAQGTPGLIIAPFEVHAGLTIYPMTPSRAKKYADAQLAYFAAVTAGASVAKHGGTQDEVDAIIKQRDAAMEAYNEALYGERQYRLVEEYFADQGAEVKNIFVDAVRKHFLRQAEDGACTACNRDGVCPHCGKHDDEGTEGSDVPGEGQGESPTSSSTTGPSSTEISPTTSTE